MKSEALIKNMTGKGENNYDESGSFNEDYECKK